MIKFKLSNSLIMFFYNYKIPKQNLSIFSVNFYLIIRNIITVILFCFSIEKKNQKIRNYYKNKLMILALNLFDVF